MQYVKENSDVLKNYLDRNIFRFWKLPRLEQAEGKPSIEIYLTTDCNQACKYCYLNRHEDKLYPKEIRDSEKIYDNTKLIFEWMLKNEYTPGIEFFSGSPLSSELGLKILDLIYIFYKEVPLELRPPYVTIPTNYTFLLNDELEKEVRRLTEKIRELDINLRYSASVDGKLMDDNRPFRSLKRLEGVDIKLPTKIRDDKFYESVFKFNKEFMFGFHPMVYSHGIENWKKNFEWFQEMFDKYGFHWSSVFLLEVRNMEWTKEQLNHYEDLIEYLIKFIFDKANQDVDEFINLLFRYRGFSILTNSLFPRGRGTTCALQTNLYVRCGDLNIVPCHRQSYDGYEFGKFIVKDSEIVDIQAKNLDMAIATLSFNSESLPYCQTCAIKDICMGGCMGANMEYNGDAFVNIPTVCEMIHRKNYRIAKTFKELGIYERFLEKAPIQTVEALRTLIRGIEQ